MAFRAEVASDCDGGVEAQLGNDDGLTGRLMGSCGSERGCDVMELDGSGVTGVRIDGSCAGIGCDAWVVNSLDGLKRSLGTASSFKGHIPVRRNEFLIVADLNALSRAVE